MSSSPILEYSDFSRFYRDIYPLDDVVNWISYNFAIILPEEGGVAGNSSSNDLANDCDDKLVTKDEINDDYCHMNKNKGATTSEASIADKRTKQLFKSMNYLANREVCFTLKDDVFTRFRTFTSLKALYDELCRAAPEKIDIGAVYNMPVNKKQYMTTGNQNNFSSYYHHNNNDRIIPLERELVFDIDMSDYDSVRSCCKGKQICKECWPWMACAARVLTYFLQYDFGFKYILPVFSGRRGIHLWVCDKKARALTDEDRTIIVGYMNVVTNSGGDNQNNNNVGSTPDVTTAGAGQNLSSIPELVTKNGFGGSSSAVANDLVRKKPIHPSLEVISAQFLQPYFRWIFLGEINKGETSDGMAPPSSPIGYISYSEEGPRPNTVQHVKGGSVVLNALVAALRAGGKHKEADELVDLYKRAAAKHVQKLSIMEKELTATNRGEGLVDATDVSAFSKQATLCPLSWGEMCDFIRTRDARGALEAAQFALLYPRLDVNVSTRRDHLLKLPFCIHPGTGRCCVPLTMESLDFFDPRNDAPHLGQFIPLSRPSLLGDGGRNEEDNFGVRESLRAIEPRWKRPLVNMLEAMAQDLEEQWDV